MSRLQRQKYVLVYTGENNWRRSYRLQVQYRSFNTDLRFFNHCLSPYTIFCGSLRDKIKADNIQKQTTRFFINAHACTLLSLSLVCKIVRIIDQFKLNLIKIYFLYKSINKPKKIFVLALVSFAFLFLISACEE